MSLQRKAYALCAAGILLCAALAWGTLWRLDSRLAAQASAALESSRPRIVLDAGHGGIDGGAVGNGITEKEINLKLTLKTAALCRLFGFSVELTRDGDYSTHDADAKSTREIKRTDLHNRLKLLTADPNALAVSIHLNKFEQSSARGTQVFYGGQVADSRILAQTIQDRFRAQLQKENKREIKKADSALFLLYNNDVTPSVLVECGFLSNPAEAEKLKTDAYQNEVAFVLTASFLDYYNRE